MTGAFVSLILLIAGALQCEGFTNTAISALQCEGFTNTPSAQYTQLRRLQLNLGRDDTSCAAMSSRRAVVAAAISSSLVTGLISPAVVFAFDGGVGGLGMIRLIML